MGLTGEGYRTGGIAVIKSALIRIAPLLEHPSLDAVAAAQLDIEMSGGLLPLFKIRYTDSKLKQPYQLLDRAAEFLAAVKLGHIMVKCLVEGDPDPDLARMERVQDA